VLSKESEWLLFCFFFLSQTRIRSNAAAVYSVAAAMIKDGTYVWRRSVIKPTEEKEVTIIEELTLFLHSPLITRDTLNTINQFCYIKIQLKAIDLSTRLHGITSEFVGFIPHSLVLRSTVLG